MTLTRKEILNIVKKHTKVQYVHETFLMKFVEDLIAAEQAKKK